MTLRLFYLIFDHLESPLSINTMKIITILLLCLSSQIIYAQEDSEDSEKSVEAPIEAPIEAPAPAPAPAPPPRPPAPKATPDYPNRLQYHQHINNQTIESKEYEHVCEIGLANPTGYQAGDTIYIKGRTDIRTGTEESTEFFNREQGHKVLFVEDYPHNDDGNGGRIWIEGHQYTKEHVVGGTRGAHTFDGAFVSK